MLFRTVVLACAFTAIGIPAIAQQAPQPPKDRKDYVIDALEMQRNQLSSGLAICEGTFNDITGQLRKQNADLTKQLSDLTAENDKLKKPAPTPDATPAEK